MSTILDALRKAQSEQTVSKGKSMAGNESLLIHRAASRHTGSSRTRIFIFCGLALLAVTGWVLYEPAQKIVPVKPQLAQNAQPTLATAANTQAPVAIPTVPVSVVPPPSGRTDQLMTPAQSSQKMSPKPVSAAPGQQPQPSYSTDDEDRADSPRKIRQSQGKNTAPTTPATFTPTVSTPPEGIKLTGIAWQDDRKNRRAVVNDLLVGEGAVIAGVKVLEIRPTMVRFEKGGSVYETTLPR